MRTAVMDAADYHVVYIDNRMDPELDGQFIPSSEPTQPNVDSGETREDRSPDNLDAISGEIEETRTNLKKILYVFSGGTSSECLLLQILGCCETEPQE